MFGPRVGIKCGLRVGLATGPEDPLAPTSAGSTTTTCTVTLADSADPVITGGDAFNITAVVVNTGLTNAASSLSLAVTLAASFTYVSASGTGWACSQSGGVVTCTRATLAANTTAPTITIAVTTGSSAVAASTSASLTGSNFTTATDTQGTTVNLVAKDATSGIYLPASSAEWTNFIARKGLSVSVPDALWLFQDASGNPADAIGSFTLTAGGTGITYQQAVTGWSRKAITIAELNTGNLRSTSASLPDISTTSQFTVAIVSLTSTTAATRRIIEQGTTTNRLRISSAPVFQTISGANTASGTLSPVGIKPLGLRENHTALSTTGFSDAEKIIPTHGSPTGKAVNFGANADSSSAGMSLLYGWQWNGTNAEISDANYKGLLQAMGFTISW